MVDDTKKNPDPAIADRVYDETDVPENALKRDRNSTAADVDRSAFDPRGRLAAAGKGAAALGAVAVAFLAIVAYSMAGGFSPKKPAEPSDATFKLDDANAERSARQAAVAVKPPDQAPPPAITIAKDPLGNPVIGSPGNDLSEPAGTGPENSLRRAQLQRLEREQRAREAAIEREQARQDAMRRAPIMALQGQSASARAGNALGVGPSPTPDPSSAIGVGNSPQRNELQQRLGGIDIARVRARKLQNRNFLIAAGGQIPCILQTALDSTLPGLTSCVIPIDIWSNNGTVVVLEKGTRVLGEYQAGASSGEYRIFVLWNRAVTPSGVSVSLGSPAADQLGRAGMPGTVDNFFWQRFGSGLLLSIVGDAAAAARDSVSDAQLTVRSPNTAAAIAVQDGVRIRPRLRAPQGQEMSIFVAKDVDFSDVYSLRLKR
jgi:type IV secretion system protein VirB10